MNRPKVILTILFLLQAALPAGTPLIEAGGLVHDMLPAKDLPAHIKPAAGKISLVADFEHRSSGMVDVYLVNLTDQDISLHAQDGDLASKRETRVEGGGWMRCDSHGYPQCGSGTMSLMMKAGCFRAWTQMCDTKTGRAATIRYKLYAPSGPEIISNQGPGIVDEADVLFCRYDALAMHHGPLEDIASVATGKVKGGQGSLRGGVEGAILSLKRFRTDKRLFAVVKEVITSLTESVAAGSKRDRYCYRLCLIALEHAIGQSLTTEEFWSLASGHLQDEAFPWRGEALEFMARLFEWDKSRLEPLIEAVLAAPGHPALREATIAYPSVVGRSKAGTRFAAILKDSSRPENDRRILSQARETIFPNPFVEIKTVSGTRSEPGDGVSALKTVTIKNISPQDITLPFARPEALILIEFDKQVYGEPPARSRFSLSDEPGSLTIKAGQSIVLQDVKWWKALRSLKIAPIATYSIHFLARSPGYWEVPARAAGGSSSFGEYLLRAVDADGAAGK